MNEKPIFPLFERGQVVITPGAGEAFFDSPVHPRVYMRMHQWGEWGDLSDEDKRANDRAVLYGDRILSAHILPTGVKIWVITEADRSVTTFLLPSEY
jgi:hypothetical protein